MPPIVEPIFLPNKGIVLDKPEQFLLKAYSPHSRNIEFYNELMQGRLGLTKFDTAVLSGPITLIDQYWKFTGSYDLLFFTTKDIYKYNFGSSRYDFLTPKYSVGKIRVENASTKIYGGLEVDNCDVSPVAWADGSAGDVTPSRETTAPKDGTAFVRLTVAAGAGVELLAYHNITSVNLTAYDSIGFWIRSSVNTNSGDLKFQIDDTAACATPLEDINIPALVANTWTWVNLTLATPANLTAVISIGIYQAVDLGACTIDIDQIVAGDWAGQLGVGDYISIGSTYSTADTWYEISAVTSDTELTLTVVYAGSTASQQAYNSRLIFQGATSNPWQGIQFLDTTEGEVYIATNGVDTPVWYDGTNQFQVVTGLPSGFVSAKYINVFFDRVIWLWCVEAQNEPVRVRWSAAANFKSYTAAHFNDLNLPDAGTWIKGSYLQGDILVVPKEKNGYSLRHVGGDEIFGFDFLSTLEGAWSGYSIVPSSAGAFYYSADNLFRFYNLLQDVSQPFDDIYPYLNSLDPNLSELITGFDVIAKKQIRWALPYNSTSLYSPVVVYDYARSIIEIWEYQYPSAIRAIGEYLEAADVYVDDTDWAELYVDEEEGYWDDRTFLSDAPIVLYGHEDGIVRKADTGSDDDGYAFDRIFRCSRLDFGSPHQNKRLWKQQWWFEAETAGSVTLTIKRDDRQSFEAGGKTLSLVNATKDKAKPFASWDRHFLNAEFQITAQNQFRLLGFLNFITPKGRKYAA